MGYLSESSQAVFLGPDRDFFIRLKQQYFESNFGLTVRDVSKGDAISVLEIGPGFGEIASHLKKHHQVRRYIALDVEPQVIEQMTRDGHEAYLSHDIPAWLGDCGLQFDLIILIDVLEHLDTETALKVLPALAAALSSGGKILLQTPNASALFAGNLLFGDITHRQFFNEVSLAQILRKAGLERFEIRPHRFPSTVIRKLQGGVRSILYCAVIALQYLTGILRCKILTPDLVAIVSRQGR